MRWIKALGSVSVTAVLLAGCGSAAESAVRETAQRFLDADTTDACGLLSARAMEDLTQHGRQTCPDALTAARTPGGTVGEVLVWGSDAQAKAGAETLFLHEYEDGWRITGGGCQPSAPELPYRCLVGGP
ncbi:hypothetical protein [Amycolatopsis albispora]|uniref:Lipoprotein n=1 Tax=Amycolatopsis albispora TaxID=1804986 RepID=A0A344LGU1_9PSEU|nr:hypothetical protein [Amycolatopsis albispora]AXB47265.1 hypothetical protein A4R43_36450 [Amycolatopsis albispora]